MAKTKTVTRVIEPDAKENIGRGSHLAKFDDVTRQEMVREILNLWTRGETLKAIATHLNETLLADSEHRVTFNNVHELLEAQKRVWTRENQDVLDEYYLRSLASMDAVEREAWQAWKKSREESKVRNVTEHTSDMLGEDGAPNGKTLTSKTKSLQSADRDGDPRFLDMVLKVQERRARLLGLDAPVRISNPDGSNINPTMNVLAINVQEKVKHDPDFAQHISELSYHLGVANVFAEPTGANGNEGEVADGSSPSDVGESLP